MIAVFNVNPIRVDNISRSERIRTAIVIDVASIIVPNARLCVIVKCNN